MRLKNLINIVMVGFKMFDYLKLMRVNQWYKNFVIFLPLIFVGDLFNEINLFRIIIGFLCLCLISSVNYIINDFVDAKKDRFHPEKRKRPLASGKVSKFGAVLLAFVLGFLAIVVSYSMSVNFLYAVIVLFISNQLYSFIFKNEVFLDILFISVNFVIRAISGTFLINSDISPWLVLCTFFLAIFLAVGKRKADIMFAGKDAHRHRKVLKYYNDKITDFLLLIATTLLIVSYALFSFLSQHYGLIWTLPVSLYVILRYFYLITSGSKIARNPELFVMDFRLVVGIFIWMILVFAFLYLI